MTYLEIVNFIERCKKAQIRKQLTIKPYLYLRVYETGRSVWIFRFQQFNHKLSETLGTFPDLSIKDASEMVDAKLAALSFEAPETYFTVKDAYKAWANKQKDKKSFDSMAIRIEKYIVKPFGNLPLSDLTAPMLIKSWRHLELDEKHETLRKLCSYVRSIAIFAINTGRVERLHELTKLSFNYTFNKSKSHAAVAPERLPWLFHVVKTNNCFYGLGWHLLLASFYTLLRQGELTTLRWEDIDSDNNIITLPGERMKTGKPHYVPISSQLKAILQLQPKLPGSPYVFSGLKKETQPANSETVRILLSRAGLQGIQTAHGIRAIGRTWMAQQGIDDKIAELCLAHNTETKVQQAYQRYAYLEERREVMSKWCDFVEKSINND